MSIFNGSDKTLNIEAIVGFDTFPAHLEATAKLPRFDASSANCKHEKTRS
ncbi:MAG: hypothetical protein ACR2KU_05780 [Gammaproteobacteria bacterium]